MIMGYRLVQAVFVVNLGRLADMLGGVRIPDRLALPAGVRRLDARGELGRDLDRRVAARAARVRPRPYA
jgi:hypothetical protein